VASEPALDWSSASVSDGKLVVTLDGELPSGWKDSFESVVTLLDRGSLEIKLKKDGKLAVAGVAEGEEEKVRHLLEGAVQQANADTAPDDEEEDGSDSEDEADDADEDGDGDSNADDDSESKDTDAEMTERFRSFAD
jgi:hypothetical protein